MAKRKQKENTSPVLTKRTRGEKLVFAVVFLIFTLYALSLIYPFVWTFINSLKGSLEYSGGNPFALPKKPLFSNYIDAFELLELDDGTTFFDMIFNSVWYTFLASFLGVFMSCVTGYCLSKYEFKARKYIYSVAIFCMTIPIVGSMGAYYKLIGELGLYDTPMYVVVTNLSSWGFNFLVMYGFFKNVSWTYAEAAQIDGAGHFRIYFTIMIPMAVPVLVSLGILSAIGYWNDYFTVYMYMPEKATIAYGLQRISDQNKNNLPQVFAAVIFSMIPVLVIFSIFQKTIMNNTTIGGIKG